MFKTKNIINFEMTNNNSKLVNVGTTAVNRLNAIDPTGSNSSFGRFVKFLLCCEYVDHNKLRSRLTKQQLRHILTRNERINDLPKWVKTLKSQKIVNNWDVSDVKELV